MKIGNIIRKIGVIPIIMIFWIFLNYGVVWIPIMNLFLFNIFYYVGLHKNHRILKNLSEKPYLPPPPIQPPTSPFKQPASNRETHISSYNQPGLGRETQISTHNQSKSDPETFISSYNQLGSDLEAQKRPAIQPTIVHNLGGINVKENITKPLQFCANCGRQFGPEDAQFCTSCGSTREN